MTPTPSNEGSSLRRPKRKPQAIKADQYAPTAEIDDEEAIKGEKGKRIRAPAPKKKKPEQESSKQVSDEKKSDQESSKQVSDEKKSDLQSSKEDFEEIAENFEEENDEQEVVDKHQSPKQRKGVAARDFSKKGADDDEGEDDCCFLGDPVPENVSRERWPHRYSMEIAGKHVSIRQTEADNVVKAKCHYLQARVDGCVYNLNDDAYVKAGDGVTDYIGRILEFFESIDHELYFTAQWFFRAEDTIIKNHSRFHDARRVFVSDEKNDNALNCIVKKIRIVRSAPKGGCPVKQKEIPAFDLYYDMAFSVAYSSFTCLPSDDGIDAIATTSSLTTVTTSNDSKDKLAPNVIVDQVDPDSEESTSGQKKELSLLDLFSGCGAMSTGLCLGANLAGVNLKTRWAVDMNSFACESLKFNHRDTEVRNEKADDFLAVIREWEKLCRKYGVMNESSHSPMNTSDDDEDIEQSKLSPGEFEVGKIVGICYGPTDNLKEVGLKFKVRWMGFGPSEDTWEPADGLRNCQERIKDFVQRGYKRNILPLPGAVDVICGGPPCQGMSGFNRFREKDDPFKDEKNKQMAVFIETIEYLKPKYVLMENVVDILKFSEGYLGRFAISELVKMKYQARLGILAAGNYGLPQYRMRVFLWGALPSQTLPQFPLPTHDVIIRGGSPVEFETHVVAYDGNRQRKLEKALRLSDAISDLPPVENNEARDEMSYRGPPTTEFQRYIRLSREEMMSNSPFEDKPAQNRVLYDHRPLKLNDDDYQRVCAIPKRKGSNFRDLPGVIIGPGNVAQWDSNVERVLLPSGKPLVPDYAMSFINGKSLKPFGRLWWDETVATVVTRAEPHNQIIIHPEQDRVLSIRENARLQGFPDYYKLFGPLKQRYIQVGNAVAVPVSRALGYAFGLSYLGKSDGEPSVALPQNFPIYR